MVRAAPENFPAAQLEHAEDPSRLEKVPAVHAGHWRAPDPDWNRPAAQVEHAVASAWLENWPAAHRPHADRPGTPE